MTPLPPPQCLMSHRVFCFLHHYPINGSRRNLVRSCSGFPGEKLHHLKGEPVNAPLVPYHPHPRPSPTPPAFILLLLHAAPHLLPGQLVTAPPTLVHVSAQEPKHPLQQHHHHHHRAGWVQQSCSTLQVPLAPTTRLQTKRQKKEEEKFCSSSNVRMVTIGCGVRVCSRPLQLQ